MSVRLAALAAAFALAAPAVADTRGRVAIPARAEFTPGVFIAANIRKECDLPAVQAGALRRAFADAGFEVVDLPAPPEPGVAILEAQISGAYSQGTSYLGHAKGLALAGTLRVDGVAVGNFVSLRRVLGQDLAKVRGSCEVLYICAERAARDAADWARAPRPEALLGEAH